MQRDLVSTSPRAPKRVNISADRRLGIYAMLMSRVLLFAGFQSVVAILLYLAGDRQSWTSSAAWWPLTATAANAVSFVLLRSRTVRFGTGLRGFYRPVRESWKRDLACTAPVALGGAALAAATSITLSLWLYGSAQGGYSILVRPLPLWAAVAALLVFPLSQALTELPVYYGYSQPQLAMVTRHAWLVTFVPASFHALQHVALPLVLDNTYLLWRGLMFLPFAVLLSWALKRRPSLMPYLVAVHFGLDLQAGLGLLSVAHG
ncbi:hypothetical protein ACSVHC_00665 [Arthrobacter sp. KNU-44]|uniref:hypothetical protein n=1 Tax=Arthrobacter sp. KNU-44 TaxID=3450744 RepID=UPI003F43AEB4